LSADQRVLVTGGTGFVGRHAVASLTDAGREVHCIARTPLTAPGVVAHLGDLHDQAFVERVMMCVRPSHLLHLAWYTEHGRFWQSEENLRWLSTSLNLVQAFAAAGGQRVVIAGTCAEFAPSATHISEAHSLQRPATLYGTSKAALREVVAAFARDRRLSFAWGYLYFLYGPFEAPQRLVPSVICSVLRGEEARCTAGTQIRDFLHTSDAGAAFAALLQSSVEGGINIASGEAVTVAEMAVRAATAAGDARLLRLGAVPMNPADPPCIVADPARLFGEVGWRPRVSLDEGLRDVADWWSREIGEHDHR
jgi:nucleoside-diphosphate-sugar epimerase